MNPLEGVAAELVALACVFAPAPFVPAGAVFGVYVVVAELLATYLIHCPAHFAVGSVLGVKFKSITMGRTTLASALPSKLSGIVKPIPIMTLVTRRDSLSMISAERVAAMYVSGTAASVASALIIALWATPMVSASFSVLAWAVATGYLLFDLVFSPRSGDIARALRALRAGSSGESVRTKE